jgi:serine/threonine protein kinase
MPPWKPQIDELQTVLPELGPLTFIDSGGWKHVYAFENSGSSWALLVVPLHTETHIPDEEDRVLVHTHMRARVRREVQILGIIECENLVKLGPTFGGEGGLREGVVSDGTFLWFTEEYVIGDNLLTLIRAGTRPPLDELLDLTSSLLDCVDEFKKKKIVHRDIKPNNIIRSPRNGALRFVLLDAGVALEEAATRLTYDGRPQGTTRYMSPEQRANQQVDWRSDLFAIGISVFEYATGVHPFVANGHTLESVESSSTAKIAQLLNQYRPDLPDTLQDLLGSLMKKRPELRTGNISMLKNMIAAIRNGAGQ